MALSTSRVGARISISLGRAGQAPDMIPARIVSAPQIAFNNGRPQELAKVVMKKTTLAGDEILQERLQNLYFAFDRTERVEELDGTAAEPLSTVELAKRAAEQFATFLATREQAVDAESL